MRIALLAMLFTCLQVSEAYEAIRLIPEDCGPLARDEFGVVFYSLDGTQKTTYFVKGKASNICPRLAAGKVITGYKVELPDNNKLFSERERILIKEFVVVSYGN